VEDDILRNPIYILASDQVKCQVKFQEIISIFRKNGGYGARSGNKKLAMCNKKRFWSGDASSSNKIELFGERGEGASE